MSENDSAQTEKNMEIFVKETMLINLERLC